MCVTGPSTGPGHCIYRVGRAQASSVLTPAAPTGTFEKVKSRERPGNMRPAGLRYDRPAPPPTPLRTLLDLAGLAASWPVLLVGELHREERAVLPWVLRVDSWPQAANPPHIMGTADRLPLRSGTIRSAVLDHALSLGCVPHAALGEAKRVIRGGGRLLIRERNWDWEMAGQDRNVSTSFRRYHGRLYFGEVVRTLDPPLEVERVSLLDETNAAVSRMLALPRDRLASLRREDFPEVGDHIVHQERFAIVQFVGATLEAHVRDAEMRIAAWLERGAAYLTLVAEKAYAELNEGSP
jgi:hypothetical protein